MAEVGEVPYASLGVVVARLVLLLVVGAAVLLLLLLALVAAAVRPPLRLQRQLQPCPGDLIDFPINFVRAGRYRKGLKESSLTTCGRRENPLPRDVVRIRRWTRG